LIDNEAGAQRVLPSNALVADNEILLVNDHRQSSLLTICIPTFKHNPEVLLHSLSCMTRASECSLLVFDDGSRDPLLTARLADQIHAFPGPGALVTCADNAGRSSARNRLEKLAGTDWLLFLDADMLPDDDGFLRTYIGVIGSHKEPALVAGGFSLKQATPGSNTRLHLAQSLRSECLPAAARSSEPGRYVFTSNILVHRKILETVPFDNAFVGWGWEDVDWGLRAAELFPIIHIDNSATHLGLDDDEALLKKYEGSGANFARLVSRHFESMRGTPLYRMARLLKRLPGRGLFQRISRDLALRQGLPVPLRLFALKLFRAAAYAEHVDGRQGVTRS
jgi:glycosyltransferase involved in cell wall biosynthesis